MKRLVIVQDVPTQFDMPLYNEIARDGAFRLTVIYTQLCRTRGIDPEIGRAPQWDHVTEEAYERIDLASTKSRTTTGLVQRIAALEPMLVVVSGYFPSLHRKIVKPLQKLGFKVGLRSDNTLPHSNFSGVKGLVKRLVLPHWLRRYDSWHPVGNLASEYLASVSGAKRPVYMFPYNVDNDWFETRVAEYREQRSEYLTKHGFEDKAFIVLGIMKWHEREDPLVLLDAFRILLEEQPEARLILVGDGPLKDEVYARIANISDRVSTPGYVSYSQLPGLYALADVFVHPAPGEPWGVSVNEALASGVPVVAAKGVGAAMDLVEEGITGSVFPTGDASALAERLKGFCREGRRGAMEEACKSKMESWNYRQTMVAFEQAMGEES